MIYALESGRVSTARPEDSRLLRGCRLKGLGEHALRAR